MLHAAFRGQQAGSVGKGAGRMSLMTLTDDKPREEPGAVCASVTQHSCRETDKESCLEAHGAARLE